MRRFAHALVVGASSGIGEAIARQLAASGARVALVARRAERLERIAAEVNREAGEERALVFARDVTAFDEAPALVEEIARALGGLDLVVYAAGILPEIAPGAFDGEADLETLRVNLLGAIAWLDPIAERCQRLGRGTIVGIGSVAGDRGRAGNPAYAASKAGLATYLEGLRNRVGRHGVRVVTVKPGFVDSAMTRGKRGLFWLVSAERAASIILRRARRGRLVAYVPARWRYLMWVVRSIPSFLFRRLSI